MKHKPFFLIIFVYKIFTLSIVSVLVSQPCVRWGKGSFWSRKHQLRTYTKMHLALSQTGFLCLHCNIVWPDLRTESKMLASQCAVALGMQQWLRYNMVFHKQNHADSQHWVSLASWQPVSAGRSQKPFSSVIYNGPLHL